MLSQGRTRVIALSSAAVAAAAVVLVCLVRTFGREPAVAESRGERSPSVPPRRSNAQSKPRSSRPKPVLSVCAVDDDEDDGRTPAERALAERIDKALEDEDFGLAASCVDEAQKCSVIEIRQAMVETLGWFGEKALPELIPFLADADGNVRESAMNEWTMALSSVENDEEKIGLVEQVMGVLRDEDALEEMSGEYIGVDEKMAVESLMRIIASGGSAEGIAKAKETYEFVTGNEWVGFEEADRWIKEEYAPSETMP